MVKPSQPMMSVMPFWIAWFGFLLLWMGGLTMASLWDLELSKISMERSALFARLVERFGEWPAWVMVLICVVVMVKGHSSESRLQQFRPVALAILILGLLHPLLITQMLKFLWGRVRFYDLTADFSSYTAFFLPRGVGMGESFPSGHVAMAMVVSPLAFFITRAWGWIWGIIAWLVVLAYGCLVSWGRILAGAHFLTDCLFSLGLSLLLASMLTRHFMKTGLKVPSHSCDI